MVSGYDWHQLLGTMEAGTHNDEMNLKLVVPIILYLKEHGTPEAVEAVVAVGGNQMSQFDGSSHWTSLESFQKTLVEARKHVADDDEFRKACGYRIIDSPGTVIRGLSGLLSPNNAYSAGCRKSRAIQQVGEFSVVTNGPGHVVMRYTTDHKETTRLVSLSREAGLSAVPTLWGVPPAQVVKTHCKVSGDDYFEYDIRFFMPPRWLWWLVGSLAGAGFGAGLTAIMGASAGATVLAVVGWTLFGCAAGYGYDATRVRNNHRQAVTRIEDELDKLTMEEAENRRVLADYQDQQRSWTRMLEDEVAERTSSLTEIIDQVRQLQRHRVVEMRGVSHDLKNPLTAIMNSAELLRRKYDGDREARESASDIITSVRKMEKMLGGLIDGSADNPALVPMSPTRADVGDIGEALRRRIRAMVYGKEIRTSVFRTREAPSYVNIDRLIFERIVDNLISNSAKYTEQGSIIVELDGRPGTLTIKVSDTGRGIPEDEIDHIFIANSPLSSSRAEKSHGLGLSIVVKLLAQIGGNLEVMSNAGIGTTFWAHFPVEVITPKPIAVGRPPTEAEILKRVVRIRRLDGGAA